MDAVGSLDLYTRTKSINRSFADAVGSFDRYFRSKSIFRIFLESLGALDAYTYHIYPYYLKLGGILTKVSSTSLAGYSLPNVVAADWGWTNSFVKIAKPYKSSFDFQQIKPTTIALQLTCSNIDALITALTSSSAFNYSTNHRNYITIVLTATKADGRTCTFQFNNARLETLQLIKLTEKLGESEWLVVWSATSCTEVSS
jgi:hypothetical protein